MTDHESRAEQEWREEALDRLRRFLTQTDQTVYDLPLETFEIGSDEWLAWSKDMRRGVQDSWARATKEELACSACGLIFSQHTYKRSRRSRRLEWLRDRCPRCWSKKVLWTKRSYDEGSK